MFLSSDQALFLSLAGCWGILIGAVLGLLGGGGAIIALPILLYGFGLPFDQGVGESLFLVSLGALPALIGKIRTHTVQFRPAIPLGLGGFAGTSLGHALHSVLPTENLFWLLLTLMVISGISMVKGKTKDSEDKVPAPNTMGHRALLLLAGIGLLIGILTGLLGVGGGFLLVPALLWFGRVPIHQAIATSLLIIVANASWGTLQYHSIIPWGDIRLWAMVLGSALGAWGGHQLGEHLATLHLKKAFGLFLLFMAIAMGLFPPPNLH